MNVDNGDQQSLGLHTEEKYEASSPVETSERSVASGRDQAS